MCSALAVWSTENVGYRKNIGDVDIVKTKGTESSFTNLKSIVCNTTNNNYVFTRNLFRLTGLVAGR